MKQLWILTLSFSLATLAVDASAQQKLAPTAKTSFKTTKTMSQLKLSGAASDLKSKQNTYKAANSPQAKLSTGDFLKSLDRSSTKGLIGEDGAREALLKRREGASEILRDTAQLKKDALAAKRDAKAITAIDGLARDAQATIKATNGLIGEDGKRAFSKGDFSKLGASDVQAKRLQGSLESVLGLVEPIVSR